jgi:hypothetical protein
MSGRVDRRFKSQYLRDLSLKHNRLALVHRPPGDPRDELGYLEEDFRVATLVQQSGAAPDQAPPLVATVDEILTLRQRAETVSGDPEVRQAMMQQTQAKKRLTLEVSRDYRKAFKERYGELGGGISKKETDGKDADAEEEHARKLAKMDTTHKLIVETRQHKADQLQAEINSLLVGMSTDQQATIRSIVGNISQSSSPSADESDGSTTSLTNLGQQEMQVFVATLGELVAEDAKNRESLADAQGILTGLKSQLVEKQATLVQMNSQRDGLRESAAHLAKLDEEIKNLAQRKSEWEMICTTYRRDIEKIEVAIVEHRRMKELSPLNPIAMMAFYGSKVAGTEGTDSLRKVLTSLKSLSLERESPLIKEFEETILNEGQLQSLGDDEGAAPPSNYDM